MGSVQLWLGAIITTAMIIALIKRYDTKTSLLAAGVLMAVLSGNIKAALDAFSERMVFGAMIEPILSVMGFAVLIKLTGCDGHLTRLLTKLVGRAKWILIPGTTLATAFVNVPLHSAAGVSAAVGGILIPLLLASGVHPALAAAAVYGGTIGGLLSPGNAHNVFIATKLANIPVMDVIAVKFLPVIFCILISAASIMLIALFFKENKGHVYEGEVVDTEAQEVNVLFALLPLVPLTLLVVDGFWGKEIPFWFSKLRISHAMLIGAFIVMLLTRTNPKEVINAFFKGAGNAYTSVMSIIICAGVFVAGLNACGVTDAMVTFLRETNNSAILAATFGPMFLAVISGSGDAATLAFNEAVSTHAADFGMKPMHMGLLANISGTLGRTASPLSGAVLICAGFAGANPVDVAKRTFPGMLIAALFILIWFTQIVDLTGN